MACHYKGPVDRRMTSVEDQVDSTAIKNRWSDSAVKYFVLAQKETNACAAWELKLLNDSTYAITQADIGKEEIWGRQIAGYIRIWKKYMDSLGIKPVIKIVETRETSL